MNWASRTLPGAADVSPVSADCRIFANGDVTPCPYLPVSAGNVRTTPFSEIWNNSELFTTLRDPDNPHGKMRAVHLQNILWWMQGQGVPER